MRRLLRKLLSIFAPSSADLSMRDMPRDVVMPLPDEAYRKKLIAAGVKPDVIATLGPHDLDCIGNLVGVYRTDMKTQDPLRYAIEEFRRSIQPLRSTVLTEDDHLQWNA